MLFGPIMSTSRRSIPTGAGTSPHAKRLKAAGVGLGLAFTGSGIAYIGRLLELVSMMGIGLGVLIIGFGFTFTNVIRGNIEWLRRNFK
jgi:hypothetical protein